MTRTFVAALCLNYTAVAAALTARSPEHNRSAVANSLAPLLIPLGTIAGFAAIGMFLSDGGIGYGLVSWAVSSIVFLAVATPLAHRVDGMASTLGIVTMFVGAALALFAFL